MLIYTQIRLMSGFCLIPFPSEQNNACTGKNCRDTCSGKAYKAGVRRLGCIGGLGFVCGLGFVGRLGFIRGFGLLSRCGLIGGFGFVCGFGLVRGFRFAVIVCSYNRIFIDRRAVIISTYEFYAGVYGYFGKIFGIKNRACFNDISAGDLFTDETIYECNSVIRHFNRCCKLIVGYPQAGYFSSAADMAEYFCFGSLRINTV